MKGVKRIIGELNDLDIGEFDKDNLIGFSSIEELGDLGIEDLSDTDYLLSDVDEDVVRGDSHKKGMDELLKETKKRQSTKRSILPSGGFKTKKGLGPQTYGEGLFSRNRELKTNVGDTIDKISRGVKDKIVKKDFKGLLGDLLSNQGYKNPTVQKIRLQEGTRIPVYAVTFTFNDGFDFNRIYIKNYEGQEHLRRKDLVIPTFLAELGIPAPRIIGYDLSEEEFDGRYAFLEAPASPNKAVFMHNLGNDDLTTTLQDLTDETTILNIAYKAMQLSAEMNLSATMNLDLLKSKYGLELELKDPIDLIQERFRFA
ncbi:hypothetical protein ACFL1H_07405 [Nanoarchaeota archaeon]